MEIPLYSKNRDFIPPNIQSGDLKTAIDRVIHFAITYPEVEKSKGTIVILESYTHTLEKYFLLMNEVSKRGFHTAIFDWFFREKSSFRKMKKNRYQYFNINNNINDLSEFFNNIVYFNCPPPYYMLTYGIGGLIALSGIDIINHKFNKMLCVSPLFSPFGNKINNFQHKLTQLLSDIGLGFIPAQSGKNFKKIKQKNRPLSSVNNIHSSLITPPTSRWMASTLNTVASMKRNILQGYLKIPTLFILANQNNIVNNIEARQLCQQTRLIDSITITGAELDTIMYEENYKKEFWAAFDAFIANNVSVQ
ncbi:lysophospholipase [Bartonella silvatica]|uniref:Lysophospholipase n=1 Tax=Bartonella silvatica TaxID=357760 RepID=A0ABV2HIA1_9HYPH